MLVDTSAFHRIFELLANYAFQDTDAPHGRFWRDAEGDDDDDDDDDGEEDEDEDAEDEEEKERRRRATMYKFEVIASAS